MEELDFEKLAQELSLYAWLCLVDPPPPKLEGEGEEQYLSFGFVEVCVGEEEVSTIFETTTTPAFSIGQTIEYGGGYWEPPDYDFQEWYTTRSVWTAVELVISMHVQLQLRYRLEADGMAEELKESREEML